MKQVAIAALTLSVWIVSLPQNSRKPSAGIAKKQGGANAQLAEDAREKQQAAETTALNSILAAMTKDEQERAAERQQEASDVKETIKAEWWLVYAGIFQTLALVGTLFAVWYQAKKTADAATATQEATNVINTQIGLMERQTRSIHHQAVQVKKQTLILNHSAEAAQKAAEAALLNAQALIHAERPWLVVQASLADKWPGLRFFDCLNQGNTPAKLISATVHHTFVSNPESLTVPPVYFTLTQFPESNLIVHKDGFPLTPHGINVVSLIENAEMKDAIEDRRQFLMVYGKIVYRDTLYPDSSPDGLHETRWCFACVPGRLVFVRSGPEEYNRYT